MLNTQVVNIFGGPGCGKSTVAAALFGKMKIAGFHCELTTEYIKKWVWEGRVQKPLDYLFVMANQARNESLLYGKVDYIITDSPFLLSPVYERIRFGYDIVLPSALQFVKIAEGLGVRYRNFFLTRQPFESYDSRGRYEDEATALEVDATICSFLTAHELPFQSVAGGDSARAADDILRNLND